MSGRETPDDKSARDVLAAEAFAMPAPDPSLRHHPITLPEDPTGIAEAHDVLAAEEFAMPAPRGPSAPAGALAVARQASSPRRVGLGAAVALLALLLLRRRRRA